jgi:hypothetical protein
MKIVSLYGGLILLLVCNTLKANPRLSSPPDSNKNRETLIQVPVSTNRTLNIGEVFITPAIGYGDMAITGSPLATSIYSETYHNLYSIKNMPEFGVSLDYLVAEILSLGIAANYQTVQYTLSNSAQNYAQDYPYSALFSRLNVGIRNLIFFRGSNSDKMHFYIGARVGMSFWKETDEWNYTTSPYYPNQYNYSIINAEDNNKISFQLLWGMRYFVSTEFGMQLELGLGTPYYAQLGITYRLNDKPATYTVAGSEYRVMNEGNQLSHKDSVNLGLSPHQPGIK